jgi:mannose-6-phosphate isomerase-like protein (cupin superfamily)
MAETSPALDHKPSPRFHPNERIERPWGWFESLGSGEGYQVKRLLVRAGNRISLQRHQHRSEHWVVVSGEGWLECEGSSIPAEVGTHLAIPQGAIHRARAGALDLLIVEVQQGPWLSEDDIERLSDDYGRPVAQGPTS